MPIKKNHSADNVPQLRFPEFKDEWERRKLGEVADVIMGQSPDGDTYNTIGEGTPLINGPVEFTEKYPVKIKWTSKPTKFCQDKDVLFCVRGSTTGRMNIANDRYCIGRGVAAIRANSDSISPFIELALIKNLVEILSYTTGSTFQNIDCKSLKEFQSNFPSLPEQKRIASFFTVVDKKIAELKQKKTLLEQYKKGVMQKLFPSAGSGQAPELRFKDDKGKEFPDWEKKKLGDIGDTYNGLTGKTKENFGTGKPYIQYKQIFDDSKIDISRFEFVEIRANENQNRAIFGDVFFTVSSETPNEIGTASVLLDTVEELYLNSFCFGYRANSLKILSPYFSRYLFRSETFRTVIVKLAQGSTRYNMSKVQLMKIEIHLPCLEEQNKISDFLSALDEKINRTEAQIQQTGQYKKGLLQNMFV